MSLLYKEFVDRKTLTVALVSGSNSACDTPITHVENLITIDLDVNKVVEDEQNSILGRSRTACESRKATLHSSF